MDSDLLRDMLALNHKEDDFVLALRNFAISGIKSDPEGALDPRYIKLRTTLSLPVLTYRERQKIFYAYGSFWDEFKSPLQLRKTFLFLRFKAHN